jgi:thiamine biosynthesis protein ThiS
MITVNGMEKSWKEGMTVSDVLKIMNYEYALIVVTVNDQAVHQDDYQSTVIEDNADIKIIHICHGG